MRTGSARATCTKAARLPTRSRSSSRTTPSFPDGLHLGAGTEVEVEVRNAGSNAHNFTIDSLNLSTGTIEPGHVMTASFVVPNGTTEYHCTFHPGMRGEIIAG